MNFLWIVVAAAASAAQLLQAQPLEEAATTEHPQHKQARRAVAAASNVFGIDLFQAVSAQTRGNLVMSPLSVGAALALAQQGARGRTAQQLAGTLHLLNDPEEVAYGYRALFWAFSRRTSQDVLLRIANKVYTRKDFAVKEEFRQSATDNFRADAEAVDFAGNSESARMAINLWVARATGGLVAEFFPKDSFDANTAMVILNAIYFKGNWATPFLEKNTVELPFHLSAESQVNVPTMKDFVRADTIDLAQINATVLQLLYNDNATRLLVFVPDGVDGLPQLEKNIRLINLHQLNFQPTEMQVQIPKFKISTQLKLKDTLKELGVEDLFDPKTANLTGISEAPYLFAKKVVHRAVVEVTEKGTEAAAASGIELVNKFSGSYAVDRPFLFMLVDVDNTVLFIGRVTNPLEQ